jgi:K+-sensing histidine kinase KdpD
MRKRTDGEIDMLVGFASARDWLLRQNFCRKVTLDQSSLMARVSFELRTLLNDIVGYAEYLENRSEEPMTNFTAKIIRESGSHLTRSCNSYFDLQYVQSGQFRFCRTRFNLSTLLHGVVDGYQSQAWERSMSLRLICPPDALAVSIYADEMRVRQVLHALVFNAIEMAEAWDVIDFHLYWLEDKSVLKLVMQSTQMKLDRNKLSLVEKFWSTDTYRFQLQEGPGVEMALAKSLIRLAGIPARYDVSQDNVGTLELLFSSC